MRGPIPAPALAKVALACLVVAALLIGVQTAADFGRRVGRPFAGFMVMENLLVAVGGGERGGLQPFDLVRTMNGQVLTSGREIQAEIARHPSGTTFHYILYRRGRLVERANPSVDRGSIDYSTGAFSVEYAYTKSPSGAMTVDYEYSALPTTSKVPNHARLSVLVISMSAGTTVDWAIYEDEAQTYPPIAQGSETLVGGSAQVSLGEIVSVTLTTDPAEMGKRWVSITPDAIADVTVRLTWEQAVG